MDILVFLIFGIIFAFWRRWFGGGFDFAYKWLDNRGIQAFAGIILMMPVFLYDCGAWQNWLAAVLLSVYLYAQFWSRGHGACFDLGRGELNDTLIKRYNERWYHVPVDYLFDKLLKCPDRKYGFLYDFIYMSLRYTMPMVLLGLIDVRYLLIGLLVTPVYAFMWTVSEKENWLFEKLPVSMQSPTGVSEYVAGFIFGFGLWILR